MANLMAIVSKAAFEPLLKRKPGAGPGVGLELDRYVSTHKALAPLAENGALFLVTVRPPDEALWLVGILESPQQRDDGWYAAPSRVPITDISSLRSKLTFANGKGLQAAKGALGMSLQTPRTLSDADVELLRTAAGTAGPAPAVSPAPLLATHSAPSSEPRASKKKSSKPASAPAASGDLAELQAAFAQGDGAGALLAALTAWRASRSAALADLVDAISARVSGPAAEDERAWSKLAASKDPLVLGRLLPAVTALPVSFLPAAADMLAAFPDDPRLARAVATWTLEPPTTSSSTYPFWTKSLAAMVSAGDARVCPLLKQRLAMPKGESQFWPKLYTALEKALAKLEKKGGSETASPALAVLAKSVADLAPVGEGALATAANEPKQVVPKLEGPPLSQAAQYLALGHVGAAIEAMLVCWRETRVPEVADLIDRATRLLPNWDRPLGDDPKTTHDTWMSRCASDPAAAMPQLLLDVLSEGKPAESERRLVELAGLPDDPRTSLRLTALSRYNVSPERTQFWKSLWELIARMRDVRVCAPLRKEFRDFTGTYYNHHRQGRRIVGKLVLEPEKVFQTWPLSLSEAEQPRFAALEAALAKAEAAQDPIELKLLAAIAENWDDPSPRLVYADWLSERGHPRGELLLLQSKPSRTPAEERRYLQLARVPHIFGNYADLFVPSGTLSQQVAVGDNMATTMWRMVTGHSLLSVVEAITFGDYSIRPSPADLAGLLMHPTSARLRTVSRVSSTRDSELLAAVAPLVQDRFRVEGNGLVRL